MNTNITTQLIIVVHSEQCKAVIVATRLKFARFLSVAEF